MTFQNRQPSALTRPCHDISLNSVALIFQHLPEDNVYFTFAIEGMKTFVFRVNQMNDNQQFQLPVISQINVWTNNTSMT